MRKSAKKPIGWFKRHLNIIRIVTVVLFLLLAIWSITLEHNHLVIGYSAFASWLTTALTGVGPELAGIVIGVLTIDFLNELRQDEQLKRLLILQMGSKHNDVTDIAVRTLRTHGWLEDGSLKGANLHRAQLQDANLDKVDLTEASMTGVNLSNASIRGGAKLCKAFLMLVNFSSADLTGADLRNANLFFANLTKSKLEMTNFEGAQLMRANLNQADLSKANLRGAHLHGADMSHTKLVNADLRGASLSEANLSYANFKEADLTGVNLRGAILDQAQITKEQLASAKSIENVSNMLQTDRGMLEEMERQKKEWAKEQADFDEYSSYMAEERKAHQRLMDDLESLMNTSQNQQEEE